MPDDSEPTPGPDGPVAGVASVGSPRVEISTPTASVVLDGLGATPAAAYALWAAVADFQQRNPPRGQLGGSVNGFQIEQADEALADKLPGGDFT
jgi:hypothetical protein